MNLKTRFNLWKLKKSSGPSMAFKFGLSRKLDAAWDAKHGRLPWYQLVALHKVGAFAVVVLLLATSGGAYAYNSTEVTEGTALYSVKEAIEKVEEVTKVTPEAKAKFYLKKIERREAEQEILKKKMPVVELRKEIKSIEKDAKVGTQEKLKAEVEERKIRRTEKSIERVEEQLEKARQIMEKTESKNIKLREEIKFKVEERLEKRKKQLEIKVEEQKEKREDLKEERQSRINERKEKRLQIERSF
ncbi:MAG: hypothetical protein A2534_03755 [Candidatus Magasanikbacteria bacterium RIFOXYD2_FULL_39_9]|uniref:DUF5667 domain-containing protein n=1 Tax=Candidatus Magasanikbacteria bacterium RIFOXYD1_FULL_40_23 TaxID=1798705 RepID=A0A1F6PB60_9BACT|nr:MAG: hypothetical protein A2534_03755 [Candidatus Magasanikbacteria bacterium RIFOXYD2_FULL_39_9]OGH93194.1 MAG: hypothetical protein A2563_01145 [Candidatus Magasanikbacteria bacterium RIFOXYD1_FULL_40_23]